MSDIARTAMLAAEKRGCPHVHQSGRQVALVLFVARNHLKGELTGSVQVISCSSAGLARAVARRAVSDVFAFPAFRGNTLHVSLLYAEAAYRHALRRARRLYVGTAS